nr:hypothetical protein [Tanacetum cinerariifolium]
MVVLVSAGNRGLDRGGRRVIEKFGDLARDKIICDLNKTPDLFQETPQNYAKCGNPVDGQYCQGCALLRKKFKEDLFTYCIENETFQDFQDPSEPSNDNTNVVNALQEPFVVKQDPDENSSQSPPHINHHRCYECGVHYGYNCPPKVSVVSNMEPCHNQNIDELPETLPSFDPTCSSGDRNSFTYDSKSYLVDDSPNVFNLPLQPLTYAYEFYGNDAYYGHDFSLQEIILEIKHVLKDKHCQLEDILELFRRLHNDVQNIHEELAVYINTPSWDRPTICYNDDDDEDCTVSITPILSTEELDNSLCMRDEHLNTILAMESDELIKSSVENLILIPSEYEGIPDNMCDVSFHDNSLPLNISKDQFEDFSNSNDDSTSTEDDSFSIDDIEFVEASPPDSELVSSEVMEIVIPEVGGIDETNTFDNSLPKSETFCFDLEEISSGSTTTRFDVSLPDYEAFYDDHVKEISSGSTTTRFDVSLPDYEAFYDDHVKEISSGSTNNHSDSSLYDSFIFDPLINSFPPAGRSDFYKFADELTHIISPPKYDCFCFKNEPNSGDFTMDVVEDIFPTREPRVHNALPTHPTLQLNLDFILSSESLFAYVVWIFLPFLLYSVAPQYLLSFRNEDSIFDLGISSYHISSFMPDVSHRSGTFMKINVYLKHLNECLMEILFSTCSPTDQ